jgi:tetratricopeptide (TPR) repeat protein
MGIDRIEALRAMVEQNPQESFARYALAQELGRAGRMEEAVAEYRALMAAKPDYAAAYFHCGQTLEKLGRVEEAAAVYETGLEVTARTGDAHTHAEIQGALDLLPR